MLDEDGSGSVGFKEYFRFSMQAAAWRTGLGISSLFGTFDRDGSGELDEMEFTSAIMSMGFGNVAAELFNELDSNGSGRIRQVAVVWQCSIAVPKVEDFAQCLARTIRKLAHCLARAITNLSRRFSHAP